ncbi:hypothetical protein [Parachlamydia sp. AcF125]|uniref:toxin-antitoxin system YwqK family antitoxin n=1 Tax=Parachlamydia sp. AcF125 TaxID=2795736 RepID=UPI001BC8D816|nr:hypothetical protein [Parachlamydia sp. AcF125]MBS4167787.1 hypothetical protein [Parachlamydia sp. AcF125]
MPIRLLCLFYLLCLSGCTRYFYCEYKPEQLSTINIIDQNGLSETFTSRERVKQYENIDFLSNQPYQKVMRVYGKDKFGNSKALITSYYPNGQIQQYLEVVNNRAFGQYKEWYPTGKIKLTATIIGGVADLNTAAEKSWLFDGMAKVWNEEGGIEAYIHYSKGMLEGESVYYHPNGKIWKCVFYKEDKIEGDYEIFLDNGDLLQVTQYAAGKKEGFAKRYWTPCQIAAEEVYENDLLISAFYYDKSNNLIAQIENGYGIRAAFNRESVQEFQEYQNGLLEGKVSVFDEKGFLVNTYHILNQKKQGEEIEFYPQLHNKQPLQPLLSIQWYEGKIQGVCKTWYRNGQLESQREMSNNNKNGISLAYYMDGNLMMIEEYDHGKLVKGKYYKKGEKTPVSEVSEGSGLVTLYDADGNYLNKFSYAKGMPEG